MRFIKHLGALIGEFFGFAWQNKAWWIVPMVIMLLLFTALVVVAQGVVPQFIYTIF